MPENQLPAVPGDDDVLEGEIVSEDDSPRPPAVRMTATVISVARPPAKHAVRHGSYIAAGILIAFRRWRDNSTTARYARMYRAAEETGNHDAALEWEERLARFRRDRHGRRMDWAELPLKYAKLLPWIVIGAPLSLIVLGALMAIATRRAHEVIVPVEVVAHITETTVIILGAIWAWLVVTAVAGVAAVLHELGRRQGHVPAWMATSADPDADVTIDERLITLALKDMRFPTITDYLKQGLPLQFLVPCRIDGRGTYCEVRLPGVAAEKVVRRRSDLAAGLYRLPKEVWPSMGAEAAILKLWTADKGALEEGAGPYPLLDEGFTDVFKGLPFGRTLRGDPVKMPAIGRNTICGGIPEQGKSNGARVVACGYTLDIITEMRIWVPDTNFDFEHFAPRCSRYVMGAEDEHIERILGDLEELKDELQRRGQLLVDYEVQEVTREIAHAGAGLHPMFCLLEEAHIVIQHKKYGKDASQLLCDIVKLDRKRGVHMFVSTQAPMKDSMPRDVTRNCANGIAFAVSDTYANDALLGAGAHRGGHRATELIPGTDRGTALCKGFSGERSEMVQVHRVDVNRDNDQVSPIVERALREIARRGRGVPGSGRQRVIEQRDLLTDVGEVLGEDRILMRDLLGLLRRLAPSWQPYKSMTATSLRDALKAEGVRVINSSGSFWLEPADFREAQARSGDEVAGD